VTFTPNTTVTGAEGSNSVRVWANDSLGNMGSSIVYFTVDTMPPSIAVTSPQNTSYATATVELNVSADEAVVTWLYSLNGVANISFTPNTTITASEGPNSIVVWANDTAGNLNSSSVYFTVDTPPSISIASPQNTTYTAALIDLNVSADRAVVTWLYSLNGAANISFTPNTTITGAEGSNNLRVWANDSTGNWGTSTVYFTVDTTPPTIAVTSPANTTYSTATIDLTWSADEPLSWCAFSLNGAANDTSICPIRWWSDSSIASGLGDVGYRSAPSVFQMDGTWYLIAGEGTIAKSSEI
jgi:hypothetical protein